jgi:transcriptional regulator with XRE-family HTH domain
MYRHPVPGSQHSFDSPSPLSDDDLDEASRSAAFDEAIYAAVEEERARQRDFDATFGARLRRERERQQVSQASLADSLTYHGVPWHQTTVAKVEAGERPIRLAEATALARLLGIPLATLAIGHDDERGTWRLRRAIAELERVRRRVDEQIGQLRQELLAGPDGPEGTPSDAQHRPAT